MEIMRELWQALTLLAFVDTVFVIFILSLSFHSNLLNQYKKSALLWAKYVNCGIELLDSELFCYTIANLITEISTEYTF